MTTPVFLLLQGFGTVSGQSRPYFQQEVNYSIDVRLDDVRHFLHGHEEFVYHNHSPDTLHFLYLHLWPNAYRSRNTALARQLAGSGNYLLFYALDENKGFIDSLDFRVNNAAAEHWLQDGNPDIARLQLPVPLAPGDSATVSTPFRVRIPSGSISRLGHIGQSYQITQWYPKPAVYDRSGWHPMPYLNQGEFYSEFGSFDVRITLPANYVVGATGDQQSEPEIRFMHDLAEKGVIRPDLPKDNSFPASSAEWKTIRFVQRNVHDFGWFADKRWMVLRGEVVTPGKGDTVTTWALFTPESARLWKKAPEYLHDAVYYYSLWNGDYPYRQVTAVDGTISAGGGMEYPNVTVIGGAGNDRSLEVVIMHEVGHNWFYGILGSDEREHAWMDEGINSFNEDRYMETKYPDARLADAIGLGKLGRLKGFSRFSQRTLSDLLYRFNASRNLDQPLSCRADEFTAMNYGGIVYKKTSLLFFYLKDYLGTERFDRAMHAYFDAWKFRHPGPEDLRSVLEESTGESLGWFFEDLIGTDGKIDFAISRVRRQPGGGVSFTVRNSGQTAGPCRAGVVPREAAPGTGSDLSIVSRVLAPGESQQMNIPFGAGRRSWVVIDPAEQIPQINRRNDRSRTGGILRRAEPLSLGLLTGLERPERTQVFWIPLVGWNNYDKWMPGVHLHNRTLTAKPFEWSVSPLYSPSASRLNGFASASLTQGRWVFGLDAQRFGWQNDRNDAASDYAWASPSVAYRYRAAQGGKVSTRLNVKAAWQYQRSSTWRAGLYTTETFVTTQTRDILRLQADWTREWAARHRFSLEARSDVTANLVRAEPSRTPPKGAWCQGEAAYSYLYQTRLKKRMSVRVFAGSGTSESAAIFSASGQTGLADVFFDGLYFGRSESTGLLSRQIAAAQGNLRTPVGRLYRGMLAANAEVQLPVRFPLSISFNAATDPGAVDPEWLTSVVATVPLVPGLVEVHVPMLVNAPLRDYYSDEDMQWADRIMFTLRLERINPFRILRNIEP